MLWAILAILAVVLVMIWLLAPRVVPWADQMTRLNPGTGTRAEWMAPPQVVDDVVWSYREGQEWLTTCAAHWGRFAQGLERYTTGHYFRQQARALASLVEGKPRLAVSLTASHVYQVRYFSSDGLQCLLIDAQTSRLVTTNSYWTGLPIHAQRLEDAALVYRMAYDQAEKRWKIERLVQQLPLGTPLGRPSQTARVRVAAGLPVTVGRDS